jgi:hypothetical protein
MMVYIIIKKKLSFIPSFTLASTGFDHQLLLIKKRYGNFKGQKLSEDKKEATGWGRNGEKVRGRGQGMGRRPKDETEAKGW